MSHEAKKKQAVYDERVELFTHSASIAVKFANALNKSYHLVIKESAPFKYNYRISNPTHTMEEIGTTNPKDQPLQLYMVPVISWYQRFCHT